ncbi:MAG: ptsI [Herbinix sp.]|jgi:phosphotransferase system enzyme I (PtsI)|nr:ptsI [Herbinix sp.]
MLAINVERTASKGIAIGRAFIVERPQLKKVFDAISEQEVANQIKRYEEAVASAEIELSSLADTNEIFGAHLEMVKDIALYDGVITKIKGDKLCAEAALEATAAEFIFIFDSMEDEYMKERAADIKDVSHRLMCILQGVKSDPFEGIKGEVILFAQDLTPSDTVALDLTHIKGFITEEGGVTSHVCILAKGLGLPALVGVEGILSKVKKDDIVIMDAQEGRIIIDPTEATIEQYRMLIEEQIRKQEELSKIKSLPAISRDGREVQLCANVGGLKDIKKAVGYGIDGVGLFRSEFLYMDNNHFPTEEEQFDVYKEAAISCGKELTIRTLDIGGDKGLSYYEFEKEENPFLGWRAIRISLELTEVFKTQLRAILRASIYGEVRIMFPMIISLEELRQAKEILKECMQELRQQGIDFNESIDVGMMIETPASILMVEDFAAEVDFFSIGTNDLTQYLLAVDRGNQRISHLYNTFHPAVLRSIKRVIDAGHSHSIKVGMCGEFAGDEKAVKLLLGMGLDEFSMSASAIWSAKDIIRSASYEEARQLAEEACRKQTISDVYRLLDIFR